MGEMKAKTNLLVWLVLFAMIGSTNVYGQSIEGNFSVSPDPVTIEAGTTAQVILNLSNYSAFTGYEFRLVLPEGISLKKAVENEDAYPTVYDEDKEKNVITHEMQRVVQEDGSFKFICISIKTTDPFVAGKMLTLTLEASSDVSGDLTASMKDIVLSSPTGDGPTPSDVNFIIRIQGKPTVTADNKSREYGDENPELTYTVSGGTITEAPTLSTTATITSNVGEYPITVEASDEYDTVAGTLTVTKAPLTINGGTYTIKQGETLPVFTAVYTGFKNDETSAVLTSQPILTLETGVTGASAPGDYDITVAGATADNYEITFQKGTLTISAADAVTVTANSYEITYGDDLPDFNYTTEGAALNGEPTISCTATAASGVGTYPITITKGTITNYNDSYINGTLTIKKAALTITAENKSKTYGDVNPDFSCVYSGFVKEETSAVLTTQPTLATEATVASGVGTYDITVSGAAAANYEISYAKGTLTVNKATLTATAKNASVKQGEATPTLEIEYSGWKNNDDVLVLTTAPTASTERTVASEPNDYAITVAGGADDNYDFTYVPGTLTVTAADPVTVTAKSYTIKYGDAIPTFEYTTTGAMLNGTPSITCEATTSSPVGTYPIVITKGTVTNYNATYVNGLLTIEAKTDIDSSGSTIVKDGVNVTLASIGEGAVAADGGLTIPDEITLIDESAFAGMTEEEKGAVTFVNLTNTNVSSLTVDRESGVFAGFDNNTLIFLPSGNSDGGEPNVVIGSTCRELVLDDDQNIVLPMDFTAQKVTYNRTLSAADDAYTICLPFSQSSDENVKFYELSSSTNDNLVFTEVNATEANKPYLAVPTIANVSLSKQTSTAIKKNSDFDGSEKAVTGYKMLGTMKRISRDDAMGFYILQDGNEWHPVGASSPATVSIPPYRAYIVGVTGSARLFTVLGDDATSIKTIKTINTDGSEQWYDMNGRKLSGAPDGKGAYIMNGKKVIMK